MTVNVTNEDGTPLDNLIKTTFEWVDYNETYNELNNSVILIPPQEHVGYFDLSKVISLYNWDSNHRFIPDYFSVMFHFPKGKKNKLKVQVTKPNIEL